MIGIPSRPYSYYEDFGNTYRKTYFCSNGNIYQ